MDGILGKIGCLVYFGMGLMQLAAIMAGVEDWLGLHWIIAAPISFILAYIPIVGPILGIIGAVKIWKWNILLAIALFFWPYILYVIAFVFVGGASVFESIFFKKKEQD